MRKTESQLLESIKKINFVITDIDGVWTDGGLYYTIEGLAMKRFYVKDGMGVHLLRDKGIEVGIISGDSSDIINVRGQRLKIDYIYVGIQNKKEVLDEICRLRNITYENIAYIGDDVNDLDILACAGLSACPADAVDDVLSIANYVCRKKGGQGAFRELVDLILKNRD